MIAMRRALAAAVLVANAIGVAAQQTAPPIPFEPLVFGGFSASFGADHNFTLQGDGWAPFKGTWQIDAGVIDARALVIERPRQQPRRRGFADAAHAGQHVGVRHAIERERVGDGAHHRLLADQVGEGFRTVFPR